MTPRSQPNSEMIGGKNSEKRRARVDADGHGDEGHRDHDPAVEERKPHFVRFIPGRSFGPSRDARVKRFSAHAREQRPSAMRFGMNRHRALGYRSEHDPFGKPLPRRFRIMLLSAQAASSCEGRTGASNTIRSTGSGRPNR